MCIPCGGRPTNIRFPRQKRRKTHEPRSRYCSRWLDSPVAQEEDGPWWISRRGRPLLSNLPSFAAPDAYSPTPTSQNRSRKPLCLEGTTFSGEPFALLPFFSFPRPGNPSVHAGQHSTMPNSSRSIVPIETLRSGDLPEAVVSEPTTPAAAEKVAL